MIKTKEAKNLFAEKVAARKKLNEGKVIGFDDVEFEDGIRDTYGVGDYDDEEDEEFLASYGLSSFDDDHIEDAIRGEKFDDDDDYDAAFDYDDISDDDLQAEEDHYFESLTKREKKLREALNVILAKKAALREMQLGWQVFNPEGVAVNFFGKTSGKPDFYETEKEAKEAAERFSKKKGAKFTYKMVESRLREHLDGYHVVNASGIAVNGKGKPVSPVVYDSKAEAQAVAEKLGDGFSVMSAQDSKL